MEAFQARGESKSPEHVGVTGDVWYIEVPVAITTDAFVMSSAEVQKSEPPVQAFVE